MFVDAPVEAATSALSFASVALGAPSVLLCACAGPARPRLACAEARCPAHCAARSDSSPAMTLLMHTLARSDDDAAPVIDRHPRCADSDVPPPTVASSIDGMRHSSFKSPLRSFDALNKHMADVPTLTAERAIGTQANGLKFGLKIIDAHACHDATRASSLTWAMSWPVA